jgi:hypothetical protein
VRFGSAVQIKQEMTERYAHEGYYFLEDYIYGMMADSIVELL